jgi:hypothetical protein
MKAQAKIVDILGCILLVVVLLVFLTSLPKIFSSFYNLLALHFPEVVSKDLAGLISISAGTPANITISYSTPLEGASYDIILKNRNLTATLRMDGKIVERTTQEGKKVPLSAWATYWVDGLDKSCENKRKFEISKKRFELINEFSFKCGD